MSTSVSWKEHESHLVSSYMYLVSWCLPAMVMAKWESAGVASLHIISFQGRLALHAGIQFTAGLKVTGQSKHAEAVCEELTEDDNPDDDN